MKKRKLSPIFVDLQLFAEGSGTADGGTTGVEGTVAESDSGNAQVANVQEGNVGSEVSAEDRAAKFEELIKGEYKDLYDEKMQSTIKNRLKGTKETVDKFNALAPTLELLGKKYGVDASDVEALSQAIAEDDSYYEEEAFEKGMSVEALKEVKKLQRENAELRRFQEESEAREYADQTVRGWIEEGETLKTIYPNFDFETEMDNDRFVQLLNVDGVDVRTAYELTHRDEIISGAMQFAVQTAEKKIANNIMANGSRPTENGNGSRSASLFKGDVSQLSREQLFEIQRRVANGEKIDLSR